MKLRVLLCKVSLYRLLAIVENINNYKNSYEIATDKFTNENYRCVLLYNRVQHEHTTYMQKTIFMYRMSPKRLQKFETVYITR